MNPAYLVRQPSSWVFRIRVPSDLLSMIGKRELRYSLHTGRIGEGKYLARRLAGGVQFLFRRLRAAKAMGKELTDSQIREMVRAFVKETIRQHEEEILTGKSFEDSSQRIEMAEMWDHYLGLLQDDLVLRDYRRAESSADELLTQRGIDLDKESFSYKKLCYEVLKGSIESCKVGIKMLEDPSYSPWEHLEDESPGSNPLPRTTMLSVTPLEQTSEPLSRVIQKYCDERERGKKWSARTKVEYQRAFDLFVKIMSDVPIRSITPNRLSTGFKDVLLKLPKNYTNKDDYKNVPIADLLKTTDEKERLSTGTVNKTLDALSGMFKWAAKNGFIDKNPAEGLRVSEGRKKRASEDVDPFTPEELEKLFHSREYRFDSHKHPHMFWLPVLGLFTGAREEELCQLHVEDVKEINGVWVLDINEEGEDKRLKTEASRRVVPLHPFVTSVLGFPAYVEKIRAQKKRRVFPELKKIAHRWSHSFSQWFTRYRKRCGVIEARPRSKVFHSFRHTFINWTKQNGIPTDKVKEIVGHTNSDITTGRYGKAYDPCVLYQDVITKLEFGVDLSHLKGSKYVGR